MADTAEGAVVTATDMATGKESTHAVHRVYLAAGVVPTAQIVLRSRSLYEHPVQLKDSQYFLFPLLTAWRTAGVSGDALHTLSQVFLEVLDARLSRHPVHLQIYSYNDLIAGGIRAALGPLARGWPLGQAVERTMVAQGYLHSDESSRMRLTLEKSAAAPRLKISAELNPETPRTVRRVVRKLLHHALQLGALPLALKLKIAEPGRGFHCGGTMPMRAQPGEMESDTLGRPCGYERVHVVDASVLPDIPATTITFSVMANAHRIGATAAIF